MSLQFCIGFKNILSTKMKIIVISSRSLLSLLLLALVAAVACDAHATESEVKNSPITLARLETRKETEFSLDFVEALIFRKCSRLH